MLAVQVMHLSIVPPNSGLRHMRDEQCLHFFLVPSPSRPSRLLITGLTA